LWFKEELRSDEVSFDPDVYLLTAARARSIKERSLMPAEIGNGHPQVVTVDEPKQQVTQT
jgi:hypothetical protein